ncbi:MAG: Holliday junction resolvase RuvX [Flavobacteriaceae bacterium]|jgi:putative Holliday junction resolvase|tara:strand:- start:457 stop:876 length:420 start_codon:yes stop_codon:yes gene_type:complete
MARIMAIDYGTKRCGIAVTDPLRTCAFGLDTVSTNHLLPFLKNYTSQETVTHIVVGAPKQRDNTPSALENKISPFIAQLKTQFTEIDVVRYDERFTSKIAKQSLFISGAPKKVRQKKEVIDKLSATLILQGYLDQQQKL